MPDIPQEYPAFVCLFFNQFFRKFIVRFFDIYFVFQTAIAHVAVDTDLSAQRGSG